MRIILGLALLSCTMAVHAEIYKYVDETGHVTYSNTPQPGAQALLGEKKPSKPKNKSKAATPAYFPKVDKATQKQRDNMRRQLLLDELKSEQLSLEAARAALSQAGGKPGNQAETVRLHEKNIEMLNQELSRLK